jgi:hypothetical protein
MSFGYHLIGKPGFVADVTIAGFCGKIHYCKHLSIMQNEFLVSPGGSCMIRNAIAAVAVNRTVK